MDRAIVFDDSSADGVWLCPCADLRSAALIRTGALTTLERWSAALEATAGAAVAGLVVPEPLAAITRLHADVPVNGPGPLESGGSGVDPGRGVLLVSARCALPPANLGALPLGHAIVEAGSEHLVAARASAGDARRCLGVINGDPRAAWQGLTIAHRADRCLLHRPWDIIRFRDAAIDLDLALLGGAIEPQPIPEGVVVIGDRSAITIASGARVLPTAVLDATAGPIVIDHDAIVRPMAIVQGPAFIGEGSTIIDRCHIKPRTAIGPVCKVNGEIGGTIFQGYANKAHEGHLGDSWVGQWANLGAGTTNSNLLNTYAPVKARVSAEHRYEDTGLVFLGSIIGDHTKTAIGTLLSTGAIIGTGCMLASSNTVPQSVRAFTWLTNDREQHFRISKFLEVATAAMARRRVELSGEERGMLERLNAEAALVHRARD